MYIQPIINFNVDLTSSPGAQVNNLKYFLQILKDEFPDVSFAAPIVARPMIPAVVRENVPGPNEKAYLEFKGITRFKHTNKALSREAQAAHYLIQAGITPPVSLENCDELPNPSEAENEPLLPSEVEEEFNGDPIG